jgi:hypothetical protein
LFGGRVFQQRIGSPMITKFAPLLADLFFTCLWGRLSEIEAKDTTDTQTCASYFVLHLEIVNGERLKSNLYDKRDDFTFTIVNFPSTNCNILTSTMSADYITQLVRYSNYCAKYSDFLDRIQLLMQKLLKRGHIAPMLSALWQSQTFIYYWCSHHFLYLRKAYFHISHARKGERKSNLSIIFLKFMHILTLQKK